MSPEAKRLKLSGIVALIAGCVCVVAGIVFAVLGVDITDLFVVAASGSCSARGRKRGQGRQCAF